MTREHLDVLFVDDEPNVLVGLQRAMRPMRERWTARYAQGGREALEQLSHQPADVVVGDLMVRTPAGVDFFEQIQELYPGTARVALSGRCDQQAVMRSLQCAHQFLLKPCDSDVLVGVVERVHSAQHTLDTEGLQRVIGRSAGLPKPPGPYQALVRALQDPDVGIAEVASIVATDIHTSVEVLKLVNSSHFALQRQVSSIEEAVALLGIENVKALALSEHLFPNDHVASWLDPDAARRHCHAVAATSRWFAGQLDFAVAAASALFVASIAHEVGLLALARVPDDLADHRPSLATPDTEKERLAFGADRYTLGSYLLTLWGFSNTITSAVAELADNRQPTSAVSVVLAEAHRLVESGDTAEAEFLTEFATPSPQMQEALHSAHAQIGALG